MAVVVGVDGSAGSNHALRWAIEEARRRRSELLLVHGWVVPHGIHAGGPVAIELFEDAAQSLADRELAAARATAPDLRIDARSVPCAPVHALAAAVTASDLLVVGSHGRGHIGRALLGSVADACLRRSTAPVAVIRPDAVEHPAGDVVVGIDGSDVSVAVRLAMAEAALRGADVVALHAWEPPRPIDLTVVTDVPDEEWERDAHALLERALESVDGFPRPDGRLVRGLAASALLDAGRDASLVIVGSRGLGGLGAALLGSVSRRLVHESTCPVIVVPSPTS